MGFQDRVNAQRQLTTQRAAQDADAKQSIRADLAARRADAKASAIAALPELREAFRALAGLNVSPKVQAVNGFLRNGAGEAVAISPTMLIGGPLRNIGNHGWKASEFRVPRRGEPWVEFMPGTRRYRPEAEPIEALATEELGRLSLTGSKMSLDDYAALGLTVAVREQHGVSTPPVGSRSWVDRHGNKWESTYEEVAESFEWAITSVATLLGDPSFYS